MKLIVSFEYVCLIACAISLLGCASEGTARLPASAAQPGISDLRVLFVSNQDGDREIYTTRVNGDDLRQLTSNDRDDYDAHWSPDGSMILFTSMRDAGNSEIYIMQADGSGQTNLTRSPGFDGQARWSPDGNRIVFASDRHASKVHLFTMRPDGSAVRQLTPDDPANFDSASWSPDGKWIAYRKINADNNKADTWLVNVKSGEHRQLTNNTKHNDGIASWAPDTTKLVYHSRRNRAFNIYVYDLTLNEERQLTHLGTADAYPQWANLTGEILFL